MPRIAPDWFWNVRYGTYSLISGDRPGVTRTVCPSSRHAVDAKAANAGLRSPLAVRRPLFHVFGESRMMNQQNISTYGLAAAIRNACFAKAACCAYVTP